MLNPKTFSARLTSVFLAIGLASCAGQGKSFTAGQSFTPAVNQTAEQGYLQLAALPTPIQHVVIIFQENRTPDYLFQGVPGADIAKTAIDSNGQKVPLHATSLSTTWDLGHSHSAFLRDYDNGKMDGFDIGQLPENHLRPYAFAPASEAQPYHDMATQYVFADRMFQTNQGPSFPAHLYIITGTAADPTIYPSRVRDNPYDPAKGGGAQAGCDCTKTTLVRTINALDGSNGPTVFPCFDRPALSDLLDAKKVTWKYYQATPAAGLWHAFDAIKHVRYGPDYKNVIYPSQTILTDIAAGNLAGVSWVNPSSPWSDHAGTNSKTQGPAWVAAVVNAIGKSKYWSSTAIFITWDDWGGWYDHVKPPILNHIELGFRVPLVVISPYAKAGYVSKVQHEFGSILAFSEETFGISKGALHATDGRADDLRDAFNFNQKPRAFKVIKAPPFVPGAADGPNDEDQ